MRIMKDWLMYWQAGVSHCSVTSEGGYEYLGLYPEVSRPSCDRS